MSAGAYYAGFGYAGHSYPVTGTTFLPALPIAPFFDPALKAFPFDDDGQVEGIHPVDHEVALRLFIPLKAASPAPKLGLDIQRIRKAPRDTLENTIFEVVSQALAPLIQAGDIRLIGTPLMPDAAGRPFFYVDYANLRLPTANTSTRARVAVRP